MKANLFLMAGPAQKGQSTADVDSYIFKCNFTLASIKREQHMEASESAKK